jgi:hypothetical protein
MSCNGHIPFGTPFVSLNLHRETFDGDKVKVIEGQLLLMWCDQCARNHFESVCVDNSSQHQSPACSGDDGKKPLDPHATLAAASPTTANVMNTIEVYMAGLAQNDPAIMEEVRDHIHSLVAEGNATFLTVLLEAIRDGLADC